MNSNPTPKEPTPIDNSLSNLDSYLSDLDVALGGLFSKLGPILQSPSPTIKGEETEPVSKSEIRSKIDQHAERVRSLKNLVEEVSSRVEV